jgi:hypothetical protein
MLKQNNNLMIARGLVPPITCNDPQIAADNAAFIAELIAAGGNLPPNIPFELHPYKAEHPLMDFSRYIIGTFPPISYVLDHPMVLAAGIQNLFRPNDGNVINPPNVPIYHGNQIGGMWRYLLTPDQWELFNIALAGVGGRIAAKNFLMNSLTVNEVNYGDIIDSAQRNDYMAADSGLFNICPNVDLICHILRNPKARTVLFNTSSTFGVGGLQLNALGQVVVNNGATRAFDIFIRQCQEMGFEIQLSVPIGAGAFGWTNLNLLEPNQRSGKLIFRIKIINPIGNRKDSACFPAGSEKELEVITGPSPAKQALIQLGGNPVYQNYLNANPQATPRLFVSYVHQNFLAGDIAPFYALNS